MTFDILVSDFCLSSCLTCTFSNTVLLVGLSLQVSSFPQLRQGVFWTSLNVLESLFQFFLAYFYVLSQNGFDIMVKSSVHNFFWTMTCQHSAQGFRVFKLFSPWVESNFHWPFFAKAKAKVSVSAQFPSQIHKPVTTDSLLPYLRRLD